MILTIIHRLFPAVLIVMCAVHTRAQDLEDLSLKHSMKQDGLSLQFTVLSPDKKGVRRYSSRKTYYWYKAQKVIGTQGGSSGYLLHGTFESQYSGKQLCAKGDYNRGLKNGEWSYWYANGKLMRREHWKNGVQKGTQLTYDTDGMLTKTTVIRGRNLRTQSVDSLVELSGKSETITVYDSLGKTVSVARYREHVLHGRQETWSADGEKTTATYRNGELVVKAPKKQEEAKTENGSETDKASESFFQQLKKRFSKKDKATSKEAKTDKKEPKAGKKTAADKTVKTDKSAGKPEKKTKETRQPSGSKKKSP